MESRGTGFGNKLPTFNDEQLVLVPELFMGQGFYELYLII